MVSFYVARKILALCRLREAATATSVAESIHLIDPGQASASSKFEYTDTMSRSTTSGPDIDDEIKSSLADWHFAAIEFGGRSRRRRVIARATLVSRDNVKTGPKGPRTSSQLVSLPRRPRLHVLEREQCRYTCARAFHRHSPAGRSSREGEARVSLAR